MQCKKGIELEDGVRIRGMNKMKSPIAFDEEGLYKLYDLFESERVRKAEALIGREVRADHFVKFIVDRTDYCPHALITPLSNYWLETLAVLEGEMSLNLPDRLEKIPAIFFDALGTVRSAKKKVRLEEKKDDGK